MKTIKATTQLEDLYRANPLKACRKALALTRNAPWKERLQQINTLLGMHGTEAVTGDWQNGYWCNVVAAYANTGDTYALTVIHVRGDSWNQHGRFIISSLGDFIERNEKRLGLI